MKEYLDKIVSNGRKEDMDCLSEMFVDLMYKIKDYDHSMFDKYKTKIVGMAYNYTINSELAMDIVKDMRPLGEYWSMDTIKSVVGDVQNLPEIYVVMNSLVNDYKDVINPDEVDTYVKMTNAWINDVDAPDKKVWKYFVR